MLQRCFYQLSQLQTLISQQSKVKQPFIQQKDDNFKQTAQNFDKKDTSQTIKSQDEKSDANENPDGSKTQKLTTYKKKALIGPKNNKIEFEKLLNASETENA